MYKVSENNKLIIEPTDYNKGTKLYQSKIIQDNFEQFCNEVEIAYTFYTNRTGQLNPTKNYMKYNLFSFTAQSLLFYKLYKELNYFIRDYIGDDRPLWMQSWLNFHKPQAVLDLHDHHFTYHGYISVDPKNTTTVFPTVNQEIKNEIGQVYIGPGGERYAHYVKVNEPYNVHRITIGFDISPVQTQFKII